MYVGVAAQSFCTFNCFGQPWKIITLLAHCELTYENGPDDRKLFLSTCENRMINIEPEQQNRASTLYAKYYEIFLPPNLQRWWGTSFWILSCVITSSFDHAVTAFARLTYEAVESSATQPTRLPAFFVAGWGCHGVVNGVDEARVKL